MGEIRYLTDTNAVIDYLARKMPANGMDFMNKVVNSIPNISIITKIEVLGFNTTPEHTLLLTDFMDDASILDLTTEVADLTISIRRAHKIKLPDAILAATAVANGMKLVTRNTSDFKNIAGLEILNPYNL
jgi:predicted nucleic acid-binding protein